MVYFDNTGIVGVDGEEIRHNEANSLLAKVWSEGEKRGGRHWHNIESATIASAAKKLINKEIGFAEFKRIVRENS